MSIYLNENGFRSIINGDLMMGLRGARQKVASERRRHGRDYGMGTKEDRAPQNMVIKFADGHQVVIPATWFTVSGKVKKARLDDYKELVKA